jgi:ABC-type nitrate/sulfonate/bicarbonate transport system permease component
MQHGVAASPWRSGLAVVALIALWQGAATTAHVSYFPPALHVLALASSLIVDRETLGDLASSLQRLAAGFGLGLVVSLPLGLAMGRSQRLRSFVSPLLTAFYPVPKAALVPILMIWFGAGDFSKILVILMGVSLPLIYHTAEGTRRIDEKLVWSAAAMGMGRIRRTFLVVLPSALPEVLVGCRVAIAIGLIVMVSSEMIARQSGIGNLLFNSLDMALYDQTYAAIVMIGVIGFALDVGFRRIQRCLIFWTEAQVENQGASLS